MIHNEFCSYLKAGWSRLIFIVAISYIFRKVHFCLHNMARFLVFNENVSVIRCVDDLKWLDTKYGDGKSQCPDMTREWCQDHGDYSVEAKKACPRSCKVCQGI